jgi:isopenicillin N synthase-like dioxygenase
VFEASRRFHGQPRSAKDAIAMNRFHRGYMAPKTSIIQTSSVARVTQPNDSESFMLMHEVPQTDPRYGRAARRAQPVARPAGFPRAGGRL